MMDGSRFLWTCQSEHWLSHRISFQAKRCVTQSNSGRSCPNTAFGVREVLEIHSAHGRRPPGPRETVGSIVNVNGIPVHSLSTITMPKRVAAVKFSGFRRDAGETVARHPAVRFRRRRPFVATRTAGRSTPPPTAQRLALPASSELHPVGRRTPRWTRMLDATGCRSSRRLFACRTQINMNW